MTMVTKIYPHRLTLFDSDNYAICEIGVAPCSVCGALVASNEEAVHEKWHRQNERDITDAKFSQGR